MIHLQVTLYCIFYFFPPFLLCRRLGMIASFKFLWKYIISLMPGNQTDIYLIFTLLQAEDFAVKTLEPDLRIETTL